MAVGLDETRDAGAEPSTVEPSERSSSLVETQQGPQLHDHRRPRRRNTEPEKGTLVGRYVVLSRLGSGAMGVVLAAYDPELDRKVAIKLLRIRGLDRAAAQARLQREAQALARLNHPNVVSVHDVGVHDDRVFVAMEFVAGQTLQRWCRDVPGGGPQPWPQVLEVFEAAGRGLLAAHAEGLVHRDFKPENVMIGDDGRVRVMDFGLARTTGVDSEERRELSDLGAVAEASAGSLRIDLTNPGALMGTPAYMAPEQFMGGEADARSDQFSYCVALYEALYGERPYEGDTVASLAYAASSPDRAVPSRRAGVPSWLRAAVMRGLSPEPHERHRSMNELLAALGVAEARRRRRRWWIGGGVAVAVVASGLGVLRYDEVRRVAACAAEGDTIEEVWNEPAKDALRRGFAATGLSYAPAVAERVTPWIDEYRESWRDHATQACANTEVDGRWSEAQLDKARWCLDEARRQMGSLVDALAEADETMVQQAVQAAVSLPPLVDCIDEDTLAATPEPPAPQLRARVIAVQQTLARVTSLEAAGRYEEGLALAREAQEEAEALSWPPLRARALANVGWLLGRNAAYAEAEATSIRAYLLAMRSEGWDVAGRAAVDLIVLVGERQARASEGELWAEHAAVALDKLGSSAKNMEAARLNNLGNVLFARKRYDEAEAAYERGRAIWSEWLGPRHPKTANALNNLGNVEIGREKFGAAMKLYRQVLAIRRDALGPEHPAVASSLTNVGVAHAYQKQYQEAQAAYAQALEILTKARGAEHPEVGINLNNLAYVSFQLEEYEQARDRYARALRIKERTLGPEHPSLYFTLAGLGRSQLHLREYGGAIAPLQRALAVGASDNSDYRALLRFALARAQWQAPPTEGGDRRRAHAAATEAVRALQAREAKDAEGTELRAEIEAWLAAHPMEPDANQPSPG